MRLERQVRPGVAADADRQGGGGAGGQLRVGRAIEEVDRFAPLAGADLAFTVAPPAWLDPGKWWALVRVGCAGRLVYTPAVKVTVT